MMIKVEFCAGEKANQEQQRRIALGATVRKQP